MNQLTQLQKVLKNKQQLLINAQNIVNELRSFVDESRINMFVIHAPIWYIHFYSQLTECLLILNIKIIKFDKYPIKICVCCGLEYSQQMLLNVKYREKYHS